MLVYPFGLPLSTWFSGHISALRDTEGHKKSSRLLSVCDFVRNIERVQIACEASALPLSQAGDKPFVTNNLRGASDRGIGRKSRRECRHLIRSLLACASE